MKVSVRKDLSSLRAEAEAAVVALAQRERALHTTPGKDAIYLAKRQEAERYFAAGAPDDLAGYHWLPREAGTTAPTARELAELWIRLADFWGKEKGPEIEGREQAAKAAIRVATTPTEIQAAIDMFRGE